MTRGKRLIATLALYGAMSATAQAQDTAPESFRLEPNPAPVSGPVDSQHPVARPTATTPAPALRIVLPPELTEPRAERATRPRAEPARPATTATPPAEAPAAAVIPLPAPDATAAPTTAVTPPVQQPVTDPAGTGLGAWLWPALSILAAIVLGGAFLFFRRKPGTPETEDIAPQPRPVPPLPPAPAGAPSPKAAAEPPRRVRARIQSPIDIKLEAEQLSGSVFYATLSYRLTLVNHGTTGTGPLRLSGDLVSAHAALDQREQLVPDIAALPVQHQVPSLASGEGTVLSGTVRMPLAAILPLAGGTAFVPLARFHLASADNCEPALAETHVFVVGPVGQSEDDTLLPFRFDQLPGVVKGLGQREIRVPV